MLRDFFIVTIFTIMKYEFSIIIPVYNRPGEIDELLQSCLLVKAIDCCEIVVIEDGSSVNCKSVVESYQNQLHITYLFKPNSGPGDSRNYGMKSAKANYFIILDSDVLLPNNYIINIKNNLKLQYVDCFGGSDKAHQSFSPVQKSINYALTSFWTTGGVRGDKNRRKDFQPRSFNMGLSKKAFLKSEGFSNIHPGEDPDLSLRLKKLGFQTSLFIDCYVYHKRRINWYSFAKQVYKFGLVRPILNQWHPQAHKLLFYFPSLFSLGFILAFALIFFDMVWLIWVYAFYFIFVFTDALIKNMNLKMALYALWAVMIQFFSYGYAFMKSTILCLVLKKKPEKIFPFLFFKN